MEIHIGGSVAEVQAESARIDLTVTVDGAKVLGRAKAHLRVH